MSRLSASWQFQLILVKLTRLESVVHIQHGQVVSFGVSELSLRHVRLLPGVVGSNEDIWHWIRKAKGESETISIDGWRRRAHLTTLRSNSRSRYCNQTLGYRSTSWPTASIEKKSEHDRFEARLPRVTDLRVQGELGHDLTEGSQTTLIVQSSEVIEQLQSTHNRLRRGCV